MEIKEIGGNFWSKTALIFLGLLTVTNFISTGFILVNVNSFDVTNVKDILLKLAVIISVVKYLGFGLFVGLCYYITIRACSKMGDLFSKVTRGVAKCFIFISLATICGSILISIRQKIFSPILLKNIINIAIIDGIIFFVPLVLFSVGFILGNKNKPARE